MNQNFSKLTPISTYGPSREVIPDLNQGGMYDEELSQVMANAPAYPEPQATYAAKQPGLNNFVDLQTGTACINGYLFKLKPAEIKRIKKALTEGAIADLKKANGHGAKA